MLNFFVEHFAECVPFAVILVALVPTLESKVAIPFAMSAQIWGENALSPTLAFFCAFIGSMLPCFFVIWLTRKIKNKTSGFVHDKFVSHFENKYKQKLQKISEKNNTFKKCFMLGTFVALPLPLTGVYTGSVIAGLLNLKLWQSFLSILIGEVVSCCVVLLLCLVFENSAFYIFIISLILVVVFLFVNGMISLCKKIAKNKIKNVDR